jgi:hypothetical protein
MYLGFKFFLMCYAFQASVIILFIDQRSYIFTFGIAKARQVCCDVYEQVEVRGRRQGIERSCVEL